MIFGTPVDITLAELAVESFFPADTVTSNAYSASSLHSNPFLLRPT